MKITKIVGFSLLAFCIIWIVKGFYDTYQLQNNYKITNGQVTRITNVLRQSDNWNLMYEYNINGKVFSGGGVYPLCGNLTFENLIRLLANKTFPVAYSTKDATQSVMILTKKNAERFDYKMPDSLLSYDSILTCK